MGRKIEVAFDAFLKRTLDALRTDGLLLVASGRDGRPNPMAIGWATIGSIWRMPMFLVLVRPSRHTYGLMNQNPDFTVNVMPAEMADVVEYCGAVSGRDHDKFAEKGLTPLAGLHSRTPIIGESIIAYECRTVMTNDVLPETLDDSIKNPFYSSGDYHRIYFGKILAVRAEEGLTP